MTITDTGTDVRYATGKQVDFIRTLMNERDITADERDALNDQLTNGMKIRPASIWIDLLLSKPKMPSGGVTSSPSKNNYFAELYSVLVGLPDARYAVPVSEVDEVLGHLPAGDLIFLRKSTYKSTAYIRRLTGAPGGFIKHKISLKDSIVLGKVIEQDPARYSRLFGEHYTCCGVCGAELTDPVSRKVFMGPTCRERMGVVV